MVKTWKLSFLNWTLTVESSVLVTNNQDNPWNSKVNFLRELVESKIHEIVDKGATVILNDDITAFVPNRHLEKEDGNKLKKGELLNLRLLNSTKIISVLCYHTVLFIKIWSKKS